MEAKRVEIKQVDANLVEYVSDTAQLLRNLPQYYAGAALPVKQQLIGPLLAEKLVFEKTDFRIMQLNEVVSLICTTGGCSDSTKKKGSTKNVEPFYVGPHSRGGPNRERNVVL